VHFLGAKSANQNCERNQDTCPPLSLQYGQPGASSLPLFDDIRAWERSTLSKYVPVSPKRGYSCSRDIGERMRNQHSSIPKSSDKTTSLTSTSPWHVSRTIEEDQRPSRGVDRPWASLVASHFPLRPFRCSLPLTRLD
jgi:hypothetical protein